MGEPIEQFSDRSVSDLDLREIELTAPRELGKYLAWAASMKPQEVMVSKLCTAIRKRPKDFLGKEGVSPILTGPMNFYRNVLSGYRGASDDQTIDLVIQPDLHRDSLVLVQATDSLALRTLHAKKQSLAASADFYWKAFGAKSYPFVVFGCADAYQVTACDVMYVESLKNCFEGDIEPGVGLCTNGSGGRTAQMIIQYFQTQSRVSQMLRKSHLDFIREYAATLRRSGKFVWTDVEVRDGHGSRLTTVDIASYQKSPELVQLYVFGQSTSRSNQKQKILRLEDAAAMLQMVYPTTIEVKFLRTLGSDSEIIFERSV